MGTLKVKHDLNVEFGKEYRDRITGFVGTCTGTAKYISGCDQVLLVPKLKAEDVGTGKYPEGVWIDDERLIDVEAEKAVERSSKRGGPQTHQAPVR